MIGALLVLVVIVVAFVTFQEVNTGPPANPVHAIDYQPTLKYARRQAHFQLLAPPSLPAGWRATSVTFEPQGHQRWHLGVLTDQNKYVGLEQSDTPVRSMVQEYVDPAASRGRPVTVAGKAWSIWSDSGGDTALVRRQGGATTLVVGTATRAVLVDYVRSLR
jgi:hypothetical protein